MKLAHRIGQERARRRARAHHRKSVFRSQCTAEMFVRLASLARRSPEFDTYMRSRRKGRRAVARLAIEFRVTDRLYGLWRNRLTWRKGYVAPVAKPDPGTYFHSIEGNGDRL